MRDFSFAARLLWNDKTFTITAALTLAVCIGANAALFTVVDHVLLRPLRAVDSDRILLVYNSYPKAGAEHAGATVPDYFDRVRDLTVFEDQALFNTRDPSLDANGQPERIHTMQVTPSFFRLIGRLPRRGRAFTADDGETGRNHIIILSETLSRRLFGDSDAIRQDVRIDGEPYVVVGVMPADFSFIDSKVQAWVPLAFTDQQKTQRYSNNWAYLGRLKRHATIAQAQAQLDALNEANLKRFPDTVQVLTSTGFHSVATRLQDDLVREVRPTLYLLWSGAVFVLMIGCVNVASLVLARSRVRLKELATRMALGAGRWRIVRQLVAEYLLLTSGAAAGGLLIGYVALGFLGSAGREILPRGAEIAMGMSTVAYTAFLAVVVGIVLGAIPAVGGLPTNVTAVLHEQGRGGTSGRGVQTMRRGLIISQVAVAFVLLIGAGLLLTTFRRVLTIDPGFVPDGVLTASVNLPRAHYANETAIRQFTNEALRAIRARPGVVGAGMTTSVPFGDDFSQGVLLPEGYRMNPGASLIAPYSSRITPGYFEAMRVTLRRGRFFDEHDTVDSPKVVIVDERLGRLFWPDADPIGRRMYEPSSTNDLSAITDKTQWFTVIGVVGEVKLRGLVEGVGNTGAYYLAQAQGPERNLTFAVHTSREPGAAASVVRADVAKIDGGLPVFDEQTMMERMERSLVTRKLSMRLSLSFGVVALLLAAIGIYGVLAYLVTYRTKEIGIRVALGSSHRAVFQLILREGLLLIGLGFVLGAAAFIALNRALQSQLFGVQATDPFVLSLVAAVLGVVGFAACALPAWQATRIDPIVALAE